MIIKSFQHPSSIEMDWSLDGYECICVNKEKYKSQDTISYVFKNFKVNNYGKKVTNYYGDDRIIIELIETNDKLPTYARTAKYDLQQLFKKYNPELLI